VKRPVPVTADDVPIACTLDAADVPARLELLGHLRKASSGVVRTSAGLRLRFPAEPAVEADVRRFAVDEQRCCTFWTFDVADAGDGDGEVVLRWDGPPAAQPILDGLHAFLAGEADLTALEGLL
jgi:hypothetical protein